MTISRHPAAESLMSCAAGSMPEAFAAVMASHVEMCPQCREHLSLLTAIGETMFELLPGTATTRGAPIMALRGSEADDDRDSTLPADKFGDVPSALVAKLGRSLDNLDWKFAGLGVRQHKIVLNREERGALRLIKVAPGRKIPTHSYDGSELSIVLRGSYRDETGEYGSGDLADLGGETAHTPKAGPTGCICLIANDGAMLLKGRLARLLHPLTGF